MNAYVHLKPGRWDPLFPADQLWIPFITLVLTSRFIRRQHSYLRIGVN